MASLAWHPKERHQIPAIGEGLENGCERSRDKDRAPPWDSMAMIRRRPGVNG
jgi:hypothetical protein